LFTCVAGKADGAISFFAGGMEEDGLAPFAFDVLGSMAVAAPGVPFALIIWPNAGHHAARTSKRTIGPMYSRSIMAICFALLFNFFTKLPFSPQWRNLYAKQSSGASRFTGAIFGPLSPQTGSERKLAQLHRNHGPSLRGTYAGKAKLWNKAFHNLIVLQGITSFKSLILHVTQT
jgi:hypothetical protein